MTKRLPLLAITLLLLLLAACGSYPSSATGTTFRKNTSKPQAETENSNPSSSTPTNPPVNLIENPPANPPDKVRVDVPYISQEGLLPTGCELVSAMMALTYYGESPTVEEILDHLKTADLTLTDQGEVCGPSPEEAFVGDPRSAGGYGCYPPVIVNLMEQLLPQSRKAVETSGASLSDLAETYLPRGVPVLVWAGPPSE